ncbi:hypothetical protein D9M71_496020 [compost metagenome]
MAAEHQAQRGHQHQRLDPRVRLGQKVVAVGDQFALGATGVEVVRALLAVIAQALQVRLGAGQDQGRLPPRRIADHPHLLGVDIRGQAAITEGGGNGFGNMQRPAVQIAERPQAATVLVVVARVQDRDHDKALPGQRCRQVMQGQRRSGIAMGQHQQGETPRGNLRFLAGGDPVATEAALVRTADGRVEHQRFHRLQVEGVEKGHAVVADAAVLPGLDRRRQRHQPQAKAQNRTQPDHRDAHREKTFARRAPVYQAARHASVGPAQE